MRPHDPRTQRRLLDLAPPLCLALALAACDGSSSGGGPAPAQGTRVTPGGPLPGLTSDELAAFERGRVLFSRRFKPSEGLGPFYNATSCESCHSTPTPGGSAPLYRNFYLATEHVGYANPLPQLPSPVVAAYGRGLTITLENGRVCMPQEIDGLPIKVAQRNSLPIYGTGLFEFVSDATILALTDPDDADGDGISGRFNADQGTLGRFGVKSQTNNVEFFTRTPLRNQMGITSEPFLGWGSIVSLAHPVPQESPPADANLFDSDGVPDPEISHADLGDLIAFTRFLAPPEPVTPFSAAAERGAATFEALGCARCHVPELPTSRFGPARAYTDLLVHEMGDALVDQMGIGVPQVSSLSLDDTSREFRTQPLWGVSLSGPFLHDGRAETLEEAILMHEGEGLASRDAFLALEPAARRDVIEFLEHL
jgi:CxxC motif-containing protein (DUF1111 family)